MFRQGDVLIVPVNGIPEDAAILEKPDSRNRSVLMEGEATGHAHAVPFDDGKIYRNPANDNRFLHVVSNTTVRHEEHDPIDLPAGDYQIIRQREYSYESGEIRYVAD